MDSSPVFIIESVDIFILNIPKKSRANLFQQGPMGPTKMEITKPVIAAVNGYCVAGGLDKLGFKLSE